MVDSAVLAHDWLTSYRGGERVFEALAGLFPQAPIYTLIHKPGSAGSALENRRISCSFLDSVPGIYSNYPKFLPLFPTAVDQLKIKETGVKLLLSSSHCVIKGLRKPEGAIHVSYIHSPMRYIYDQFDAYFGKTASLPQRLGGRVFRSYLMDWDIKSNQDVDHMIANSRFVQARIKKYYNRDSVVIHPFVELDDFRSLDLNNIQKEDYFLMVGAFTPNKRVDLAIEAFNQLNLKLKIVGSGHHEAYLKKIAGPNIEFLGLKSRTEVIDLMAKARAFIFPGVEDFGITPLESLAAGTPVVAFKGGGVLETVTEETAVFFDQAEPKDLMSALEQVQLRDFDQSALRRRAEMFSREEFENKTRSFLNDVAGDV